MKFKLHHKLKPLIIIAICFVAIGLITAKINIGFNQSNSLSGRVFLIVKGTLPKEKFDIVSFKSVEEIDDIQKNGSKYPKAHNSKVKYVIGFSGDVVLVKRNVEAGANHIYINGRDVGIIKEFSLVGARLLPIINENNSLVIPQDYYFVWTPHKDSDDSRYSHTGLVHKSQIIGRAYEIL
jgi:conjugal transfer pilin signal peptidase TrbI